MCRRKGIEIELIIYRVLLVQLAFIFEYESRVLSVMIHNRLYCFFHVAQILKAIFSWYYDKKTIMHQGIPAKELAFAVNI